MQTTVHCIPNIVLETYVAKGINFNLKLKVYYSVPPVLGPPILGKFDFGDTFVLHRFLL